MVKKKETMKPKDFCNISLEIGDIVCYVVSNKLSIGKILRFTAKGVSVKPVYPVSYSDYVFCPYERVHLHNMNESLKEMPEEWIFATLGLKEEREVY